jgi:peptidoglycan/xylan/chitin deacetylase (PgdA/CDA1 family)
MATTSVRVPILLYHSVSADARGSIAPFTVSPDEFRRHLDIIVNSNMTPLTVTSYATTLLHNPYRLPQNPVLITFDDGFSDFISDAYPALCARQIVSTLYATTGFIKRRREMLTWSQLDSLDPNLVEIGGHSDTHPELDTISRKHATREIRGCKIALEDHLGREVNTFAYPHGYSSSSTRQITKECGYLAACGVHNAFSSPQDELFSLSRLMIRSNTTVEKIDSWLKGKDAPECTRTESARTRAWRMYRRSARRFGRKSVSEL